MLAIRDRNTTDGYKKNAGGVVVDQALSSTSPNPPSNSAVTTVINTIRGIINGMKKETLLWEIPNYVVNSTSFASGNTITLSDSVENYSSIAIDYVACSDNNSWFWSNRHEFPLVAKINNEYVHRLVAIGSGGNVMHRRIYLYGNTVRFDGDSADNKHNVPLRIYGIK